MLDKHYDHHQVEQNKYQTWKEKGYFKSGQVEKEKFSMVIPPPNVTGILHLGHAFNMTIQDIIARYKKAKGYDVLWLPGMDHAGIATQAKVEQRLRKQGLNRYDMGRVEFLKQAWNWKDEYASIIHQQFESLGLSLDYSKERFTLDEGLNKAVRRVFVELYNKGYIYRGERIINWDPVLKTALSNIEVIHQEDHGKFYYFKYYLEDSNEYLTVATTRPETMFGDVCVVVNPKDERYKDVVGKYVINPANHQKLIIIADRYVDIEFGTGAMKCTPAHDPNDFIIGEKYHLPHPVIMNEDATMNELCGEEYVGLDRFVCREKLVKKIEEEGNLLKIEEITHQVGHSERSNCVVEPYLSKQWFVRMDKLSEASLKLQEGEDKVEFLPERFNKIFVNWMSNCEDWCISRQLWWGHRIPAYYSKTTGEVLVSEEPPANIEDYVQDEDVLDTWFSSALWPFSTLGWPNDSEDLKRYYPLDILVTAYDIIFFWVSRMIFQGLEFTGTKPFKKCLIHGLIRDSQGRKMSKSLGNGVDPQDVIKNYGVDALRYFLTTSSSPGLDVRYNEEKVIAAKNYLDKIWNASRYILSTFEGADQKIDVENLDFLDKYILHNLQICIQNVTQNMDKYDLANASTHLYNFVYDDFTQFYLEMSKVKSGSDDPKAIATTGAVLHYVLKSVLMMIYPYTPFIAEEIYLQFPSHLDSIMLDKFPEFNKDLLFPTEAEIGTELNQMIKDIRVFKIENGLAPNSKVKIHLHHNALNFNLTQLEPYLRRFGFANEILIDQERVIGTNHIYRIGEMIIESYIDKNELIAKYQKEIEHYSFEVERCQKMLNNPRFVSNAPEDKIQAERKKLEQYVTSLNHYKEKLKELQ